MALNIVAEVYLVETVLVNGERTDHAIKSARHPLPDLVTSRLGYPRLSDSPIAAQLLSSL